MAGALSYVKTVDCLDARAQAQAKLLVICRMLKAHV